uniref:ANK_REP_REGION domain-containing protein n=1 Tax=Heterorhabditis bacteriophora TaxID=37862 RepID=A0A1I7XUT5_HETBA
MMYCSDPVYKEETERDIIKNIASFRLQAAPLTASPSHFTYTQQNGHTILAKTQGTSMSPNAEIASSCELISTLPPKESRSVSVSTGPLPPAKPCIDCPIIRKELQEAIARIPPSKPAMFSIATGTELGYRILGNMVDIAVGDSVLSRNIGTEMEKNKLVDRGSDSCSVDCANLECQTEPLTMADIPLINRSNTTSTMVQTEYVLITEPDLNKQSLSLPLSEDKSTLKEQEYLKKESKDRETMTSRTYYRNILCQTEPEEEEKVHKYIRLNDNWMSDGIWYEFIQLLMFKDYSEEGLMKLLYLDEEVKPRILEESDIADSLWLIPAKTNAEVAIRADDSLTYVDTTAQCMQCLQKEQIFTRNVGVGACSVEDKVCIGCDNANSDEIDENEAPGFKVLVLNHCFDFVFCKNGTLFAFYFSLHCGAYSFLTSRWPRISPNIPYSSYKNESESDDESDGSEGSYETNEDGNLQGTPFEISAPLREALESLNSHLLQPGTITADTTDWALKYVQHEWLKSAARKNSRPEVVEILVEQLKELSPSILKTVVNITDQNGNTALHYAVSHANFLVVSALLDSAECQLNLANKAGYTAVMLAALSSLENDIEKAVVQRLFEMGDVNARAAQHGQTALMLSVSHGKKQTTELLLQCGAEVNLQDEEGSTALMCAAEHGHKDLVKLLLSQPGIDAALTDCDSSTALSIAVENGHRDIGVLIYAHLNYNRAESLEDA